MKQKLFKTLCAALFLASTMPGYALVCSRPCGMTQNQMLTCAKSCASLKGSSLVSVSSPDCVRVQARLEQSFLAAETVALAAPVAVISVSQLCLSSSLGIAPRVVIFSRGSPSPGPVQLALLEIPSQNSPPAAA